MSEFLRQAAQLLTEYNPHDDRLGRFTDKEHGRLAQSLRSRDLRGKQAALVASDKQTRFRPGSIEPGRRIYQGAGHYPCAE